MPPQVTTSFGNVPPTFSRYLWHSHEQLGLKRTAFNTDGSSSDYVVQPGIAFRANTGEGNSTTIVIPVKEPPFQTPDWLIQLIEQYRETLQRWAANNDEFPIKIKYQYQ